MDMVKIRRAAYLGYATLTEGDQLTSFDIADELNLHSSQVRRDLAEFDCKGRRGVGYDRAALIEALTAVVRQDEPAREITAMTKMAVLAAAGAGRLA